MEANTPAVAAVAAALALVAAGVPAVAHDADNGHPPPHCDPLPSKAQFARYERARLRAVGYAEGTVGGVPLEQFTRPAIQAVDDAYPYYDFPTLFGESDDDDVLRDIHVAGERVDLHFPGVLNAFLGDDLPGGTPTASVKGSAYPPILGSRTYDGAMRLRGQFTGRIVVYEEETDKCQSNEADADIITLRGHKVLLEGWATPWTGLDDASLEPHGEVHDLLVKGGRNAER